MCGFGGLTQAKCLGSNGQTCLFQPHFSRNGGGNVCASFAAAEVRISQWTLKSRHTTSPKRVPPTLLQVCRSRCPIATIRLLIYIGVILGYMGIMGKKMETNILYRVILGFVYS